MPQRRRKTGKKKPSGNFPTFFPEGQPAKVGWGRAGRSQLGSKLAPRFHRKGLSREQSPNSRDSSFPGVIPGKKTGFPWDFTKNALGCDTKSTSREFLPLREDRMNSHNNSSNPVIYSSSFPPSPSSEEAGMRKPGLGNRWLNHGSNSDSRMIPIPEPGVGFDGTTRLCHPPQFHNSSTIPSNLGMGSDGTTSLDWRHRNSSIIP